MTSTLPGNESAERKRPLQFSLRFALGVVTGAAVLCAAVKTAGEAFSRVVLSVLLISCGIAAYAAALSLLAIVVTALLPNDKNEKAEEIWRVCRFFSWAVIWCLVAGLLVVLFFVQIVV